MNNKKTTPSRLLSMRDEFLLALRAGLPRRFLALLCLLTLAALIVLASLAPHGLQNGDAAIYSQQIEARDFGTRTIHIGYFFLGAVFTRLVPLDPDFSLNILSALLGALCVGLVASIAYTITGRFSAALASFAVLLTYSLFVMNACFAEVYIPQLFFFLLSLQFVLWNRPVFAGLSFASAFLITPSTVLAAPFLILLRPRRRFLILSIGVSSLAVVVLFPYLRDFLYGTRGVATLVTTGINPAQATAKELRELIPFSVSILFMIVGFARMITSVEHRLFALGVVCLWLFPFLFGEKFEDVPVQMPLYSVLAILAGAGFAHVIERSGRPRSVQATAVVLFILGLVVSGSMSYSLASRTSRDIDYYRETVLKVSETGDPGFIAIGRWTRGVLFEHYIFRKKYHGVWIATDWLDGLWGEKYESRSREQLKGSLSEGRQIWLLGPHRRDIESLLEENGYEIEPFRDIRVANKEH